MERHLYRVILPLFVLFGVLGSEIVLAADIPLSVRQAVVWVRCGNRRGSGVVVNGEKGYVLTNAHILVDLETLTPESCTVGLVREGGIDPEIFYRASWVRYAYEEDLNRDFAILKLGEPLQSQHLGRFPSVKTDEFSRVHDPISILAYPSSAAGMQFVTTGTITGLTQGIVKTNAEISPGASGGAGLDANNHLIGISTRILLREISPGIEEVVDYELVDIRAVIQWMDTFGPDAHDEYVTHADFDRFHGVTGYIIQTNLQCTLLARTALSDAVFCLKNDGTRSVFPNAATFLSWFGDFSAVIMLPPEQLADYRLTQSVTLKPGTLVKIQTDPKVYLVSDIHGTLRWIENEARAVELYGEGWAGFVKDVPDEFFAHYRLGAPIQ